MAQVNKDHRDSYNRYQRERYKRIHWPKCKDCGYIARYFWDLGCLNCHATRQPRRDWNPEEDDLIEQFAGKDDIPHLQYRLYLELGSARSRGSIDGRQENIGIKVREHQDGFTIDQLAKMTGKDKNTINNRIRRLGIANLARGRIVLISPEDGQRVLDYYKGTDRPSYSTDEAMRIMGYQTSGLYAAMKAGLPSWTEGYNRRVCKRTIDRAAEYLKTTGKIRVPWSRLIQ